MTRAEKKAVNKILKFFYGMDLQAMRAVRARWFEQYGNNKMVAFLLHHNLKLFDYIDSLADDDICAREEARHVEQAINNAVK